MELTSSQQYAADTFRDFIVDKSKTELVISGFAGTGKSTLVSHLLHNMDKEIQLAKVIYGVDDDYKVIVTATTNKAARVIGEIAGHDEFVTIYSLLGLTVYNDYKTGETNIRKKDQSTVRDALIFIDEASFVDHKVKQYIDKYTHNCKLVYIGDPYQLTPTKSTNCIVFNSGLDEVKLSEIVRNEGAIQEAALQYKDAVPTSNFPIIHPNDKDIIHCTGEQFQSMINETFSKDIHPNDAKVLAWSNNRVHQYNDYIKELKGFTEQFSQGESVITNKPIQTSIGSIPVDSALTIESIGGVAQVPMPDGSTTIDCVLVTLSNGATGNHPVCRDEYNQLIKHYKKHKAWVNYFFLQNNLLDLRPNYSVTVHKSQGSTYGKVFIDLSDIGRCNVPSTVARMLYVAFSRAKSQIVLYGQLPSKYGGIYEKVKRTS